jgi:hypothetical protein
MSRYGFAVVQEGMEVAFGDAPTYAAAEREGMHYAVMYAQDGPAARLAVFEMEFAEGARKALLADGDHEEPSTSASPANVRSDKS